MIGRIALAIGILAALPAGAETTRVEIDGTAIVLSVPDGHCLLEKSHPADRNILETVERVVAGSNRVLAAFADCEQRAEMRGGRRSVLDDFGQYMTPVRAGVIPLPPAQFAQRMTETFKQQGAQLLEGAEADTRERLGGLKLGIRMGENKMLGVLRTDERASYVGIVQNLGLPDGTTKLQVGIAAFGLQKQRMVSLNLYGRFEEGPGGANTTLRLLQASVGTYANTSAANAR